MGDASVVPGNRNLASSYVPRDFTDELLDRGTISISDFSERARAHSHFPYVSSSTVREYENSVVTTTTTTTTVVVVGYRLETLPLPPIVISKISDCYSSSNGTLAKFVVSRTLMQFDRDATPPPRFVRQTFTPRPLIASFLAFFLIAPAFARASFGTQA